MVAKNPSLRTSTAAAYSYCNLVLMASADALSLSHCTHESALTTAAWIEDTHLSSPKGGFEVLDEDDRARRLLERDPKQLHLGSHPLLAFVVLFPFAELFQALWGRRRNAVHEKSSDLIEGKGGGRRRPGGGGNVPEFIQKAPYYDRGRRRSENGFGWLRAQSGFDCTRLWCRVA